MALNWSSVRFRRWAQTARALECEATTGPCAVFIMSQKPASDMWDTSGYMRSASIRRTKLFPLSDSPRSGSSQLVPHRLLALFHTGFSSRTPHSWAVSRFFSSHSSRSAPAMLNSAAIFPCRMASSTSAPLRQSRMQPLFSRISSKNRSCSHRHWASIPSAGAFFASQYRAKNCAYLANPPPRTRSMCPPFSRRQPQAA